MFVKTHIRSTCNSSISLLIYLQTHVKYPNVHRGRKIIPFFKNHMKWHSKPYTCHLWLRKAAAFFLFLSLPIGYHTKKLQGRPWTLIIIYFTCMSDDVIFLIKGYFLCTLIAVNLSWKCLLNIMPITCVSFINYLPNSNLPITTKIRRNFKIWR